MTSRTRPLGVVMMLEGSNRPMLRRPMANGVCTHPCGAVVCWNRQVCNLQIMLSLLMAMALKTNLPQPGTFESFFFGACNKLRRCCDTKTFETLFFGARVTLTHAATPIIWGVAFTRPLWLAGHNAVLSCPGGLGGRGVLADFLLSFSTFLITLVGSYSLYKCISKKAKTAAKMGKKLRAATSKSNKAQVHPL